MNISYQAVCGKFVAALLAAPHVLHVERLGRVHLVSSADMKVVAELDAVRFILRLEVVVVSTLGAVLSVRGYTATTMKPRRT